MSVKLSLIISSLVIINISAQTSLYHPKEFKAAYNKQTRSMNGAPGINYWQNRSSYKIDASVNPVNKVLTGHQFVTYENNSPDTLKMLVFKLYQNMNKKGSIRSVPLEDNAITDGMNVTSLKINSSSVSLKPRDKMVIIQGTNLIVKLSQPLTPKGKIDAEVEWNFQIPASSAPRMGVTDSVTYFVAYWYPKIAVYDDIDGWDMYNYDGMHEFYFEYSNYDVEITMPRGFIVWGTGMPLNLSENLSDEIMERYKWASVSDTIIKIITKPDLVKKNIIKGNKDSYTWKYKADNVPDFVFGTSAHYVWQMTTKKMNGRIILIQTVFNPDNDSYNNVIVYAKGAIDQFPEGLPGIPYPYPQITIFNGDSGMEFPMMVNDEAFPNKSTDVYVTIHEITHTFFPFYVNMSETKYFWFDEGMAYFLPQKIQLSFDPSDHRVRAARGYSGYAGKENDLPVMTNSYYIEEYDLSTISYYKSGIAFDMLRNILGDDLFKTCLREFVARWNGKHPTPYDFFYTFNDVSGKDLNWFWQKWFFERGFPDLAVKDVKYSGGKANVLVERIGNYPTPVELALYNIDGNKVTVSRTAEIWSDGETIKWIPADIGFEPVSAEIGALWIPDSDPGNNKWVK